MATVAAPGTSAQERERRFFFNMALAILATCVAGFGLFFAIGASSFGAPWWVHLHAVSMTAWIGLYMVQNTLVLRGNVAAHRRLGMAAAVGSVWIVALGFVITAMDVRTGRVPPFFEPGFFLVMDWLNMVAFAGLTWTAVRLRTRADWHKRLMLAATLNLITVAWGRLTLPFIFDQRGIWLVLLILLGYFGVAMAFDRRTYGKIHPAHFWGAGTLIVWVVVTFLIADLPPVARLTAAIAA